jgi:addiction module HigA family antidote
MNALILKHPGELLREEFIEALELTVAGVARATGISQPTLSQVVNGRRPLTSETALRLGRFFGVDAQWFINLQSHYDLRLAERRLATELKAVRPMAKPILA